MSQMFVIGEDALSCALGEQLVTQILKWTLPQPPVNTKGVNKLREALPRYVSLARIHPVLCIADTDGKCAVNLVSSWLPAHAPANFLLRLAVSEAESWLLADHLALAEFFSVPANRIPGSPDMVSDAKREVLALASKAKKRLIRQDVVSAIHPHKPGSGYNLQLCEFVARHWSPLRAAERSPSLARATRHLAMLASS